MNQRDVVFALTPADVIPEPTPEKQAERSYYEACRERFKTLVNRPAPELTVAEWLSGPPVSIEDMKGKTIALHFWTLNHNPPCPTDTSVANIAGGLSRQRTGLRRYLSRRSRRSRRLNNTSQTSRCLTQLAWTSQQRSSAQKAKPPINTLSDGAIPFVLIDTAGQITGGTSEHDLEAQIQILLAD